MPTHDDAAYKAAYKNADRDKCYPDKILLGFLRVWFEVGRAAGPSKYFGRIDGLTDILLERDVCASVLDWHKKPAGDELPW